jgi:hypothetical protein
LKLTSWNRVGGAIGELSKIAAEYNYNNPSAVFQFESLCYDESFGRKSLGTAKI